MNYNDALKKTLELKEKELAEIEKRFTELNEEEQMASVRYDMYSDFNVKRHTEGGLGAIAREDVYNAQKAQQKLRDKDLVRCRQEIRWLKKI